MAEQVTTTQVNSLKIAAINVNSIWTHHRRYELQQFLEANNIDIALISETKLQPIHNIKFEHHDIIRRDRQGNKTEGGGTAICVRKSMKHYTINYPNSRNNKVLEYAIINIPSESRNQNLFIISIYASHKNTTKMAFTNELTEIFTKLKLNKNNNRYIIAGDLNARHTEFGDTINAPRGKYLTQWEKMH